MPALRIVVSGTASDHTRSFYVSEPISTEAFAEEPPLLDGVKRRMPDMSPKTIATALSFFAIPGVENVELNTYEVRITIFPQDSWRFIEPQVIATIKQLLGRRRVRVQSQTLRWWPWR